MGVQWTLFLISSLAGLEPADFPRIVERDGLQCRQDLRGKTVYEQCLGERAPRIIGELDVEVDPEGANVAPQHPPHSADTNDNHPESSRERVISGINSSQNSTRVERPWSISAGLSTASGVNLQVDLQLGDAFSLGGGVGVGLHFRSGPLPGLELGPTFHAHARAFFFRRKLSGAYAELTGHRRLPGAGASLALGAESRGRDGFTLRASAGVLVTETTGPGGRPGGVVAIPAIQLGLGHAF
jgi:hypothetical protein